MFGLSLSFWQQVVFWLWGVTALGGGVAITTALASSVISYYIADATTKEADDRITKADAKASEAATLANQTGTDLEKEKVKRIELERKYAWRTIDPSLAFGLTNVLSNRSSGKINIGVVANDPEASYYADQIATAIRAANWTANLWYPTLAGYQTNSPLVVADSDNQETKDLLAALDVAHVKHSSGELPKPGMWFGTPDASYPVSILIGPRLPPN